MLPLHRRAIPLASLAGRQFPGAILRAAAASTSAAPSSAPSPSSLTPDADSPQHARRPLTGSAKLFQDALAEESHPSTGSNGPSTSNRDHLRQTQGPIWDGDESTPDAVLRMLVDAHKPLRNEGGVKHNASDERIKGWMKGLNLEPRLGPGLAFAPPEPTKMKIGEDGELVSPHRTSIPPHLHRPWHSTYTGEKQAAETPRIKYGEFIKTRADGDALANLMELQLPPNADAKQRARVKEARKAGKTVGRLDRAREGALDYKLGLGVDGAHMVELGGDDMDGVDESAQSFKGNRQMRGSSVLGAQKGGASGMRAWGGLVEDRIQRAREAGFFKITNGKGKPIPKDPEARNPHLDSGELLMNRIVKRQGALPPWIELLNMLDNNLAAFRSTLLQTYTTHLVRTVMSTTSLSPLPPLHSIPSQDEAWEAREFKFHQENIKQLNDLVRRMNAQAPSPARRNLLTLDNELNKIRGEVLKNAVWEEVKRRAEQSVMSLAPKASGGLPSFMFDNEGWAELKSATRRSFGTLAPGGAVAGNGQVGGLVGSSREYTGGGSSGGASGGGAASEPRPLRAFVIVGAGLGAVVYLHRRRPVHNDSIVDFIPLHPAEKTTPSTPSTLVASSPSEPPITVLGLLNLYIIEPMATLFRFFQLAFLFLPVIVTSPMLLVGQPERRRRSGKHHAEEQESWGAVWWYGFLVKQMERAGPSFIKLGQWAASRADLFPAELCDRMSKLHSNGKPHSLAHTKLVMEKAFRLKFDEIFEEFDETPIGCGAIAQVYKAKLKPEIFHAAKVDGPDALQPTTNSVAIKVIHPRARNTIRRDIAIMSIFANIVNAFPGMQWFSLPDEVAVFGAMMNSQLDLRVEASNLDKFESNFRRRGRRVSFPMPIKLGKDTKGAEREEKWDVLIEEFEDALPLKYFLRNGGGQYDHRIANIGLDAFLEMLLLDNWTHGDLHPGNIMVRFYKPTTTDYLAPLLHRLGKSSSAPNPTTPPHTSDSSEELTHSLAAISHDRDAWLARLDELASQGYEPQLIFIDAGLVTSLDQNNRRNFLDLFQAVAEFDGYKAGKLMIERCRTPEYALDEETFALKMQHIVLSVKSKTFSLAKIKISDILTDVLKAVRQHHVKMEGDFVNTVISILLLEGIGRQLDPDMDLFKSALPILRQLGRQMSTMEAISATPTGSIWAMIKVWVWVEAREVAGEVSVLDQWIKYDRLFPSV